jgi:hypothetical protein
MAKPSITLVKEWTFYDGNDYYEIYEGTAVFDGDYFKVVTGNGTTKYFYGETAWSDAERYAYDYSVTKQFG